MGLVRGHLCTQETKLISMKNLDFINILKDCSDMFILKIGTCVWISVEKKNN